MKKTLFLLFVFALQASLFAQPYFPDGTKWTEIRLDTLEYNSWYSKIDGEWVPNFETIEYYVKGDYTDEYGDTYKCVYTNGPEWTDSLTLLIYDGNFGREEKRVFVSVLIHNYDEERVLYPGEIYQFDWSIGKTLYYRDILESNTTSEYPILFYYGTIKEIKEDYFGGVRPLKYIELNDYQIVKGLVYDNFSGIRIIQGIGVTEWKNGECLFGPSDPYDAHTSWIRHEERHYRSMLVHFERDGEVLYDVWPQKGTTTGIVFPLNPSDKKMVNGKSANRKSFDLQGLRFSGKPARGIYIEDGMKKVIK